MSFSRLRNRLKALERGLALPLAVIRARPVAQDLCEQWAATQAEQKTLPTPFQIVQKVREAGIRNASFMDLHQYIQRCLDRNSCPEPGGFLNSLLPRACRNGLIRAALQSDFPDRNTSRHQLAEPSETEISIEEAVFPLALAGALHRPLPGHMPDSQRTCQDSLSLRGKAGIEPSHRFRNLQTTHSVSGTECRIRSPSGEGLGWGAELPGLRGFLLARPPDSERRPGQSPFSYSVADSTVIPAKAGTQNTHCVKHEHRQATSPPVIRAKESHPSPVTPGSNAVHFG